MSNILTPQAFIQTSNGKKCYLYSGVGINLSNTYQDIVNAEVGLRDIETKLQFTCNWQTLSSSVLAIQMYINGEQIFISRGYGQSPNGSTNIQDDIIHLMLPRGSTFRVEAKSEAGGGYTPEFGVTITGKYLSE
tara:strand:- start:72 stop:473 length:402 start_codon:yes stop_codon:yes gene_type:complete